MEMPSEYHRRLPWGERVSADPLVEDGPYFPFEGGLQVKPLEEPTLPEPPRRGEPGGEPCPTCEDPDRFAIWYDDQWRLLAFEPSGLPLVVLLVPNAHHTLDDLPPELTASLGPMIQRVTLAMKRIDAVARSHFSRWGDGSEHFHVWFLGRPLGMMQLRGAMIAAWDDMLPKIPDEEFRANARTVATALAETSGRSMV